jgi:hypothetical protein
MKFATSAMISAAMALSAVPAQAAINLITNGSFEQIGPSVVFVDGVAQINGINSTALTRWQTHATFQYKINRNYDASAGKTSVDLSGPRALILPFNLRNLEVGKKYHIAVDLSGNPAATVNPVLKVSVLSNSTHTFAAPAGPTASNMGWVRVAADFIATQTVHIIHFANADPNSTTNNGPVIDNVFIGAAVPEPQNWALFIIGFGVIGVVSRRKATRQTA